MSINHVIKRDGAIRSYEREKIAAAISKAFEDTETSANDGPAEVAQAVETVLLDRYPTAPSSDNRSADTLPTVEEIQDVVEEQLMKSEFPKVAKAYILYRSERSKMRERNLFNKRTSLKPYEYPELLEYVEAIQHSYWVHTEFNYTSDVNDFKENVTDSQRSAIKNAMLAIAQIEVAVKSFWGDLYKKMPKPEIGAVGATFAESEVRHMRAYSHLLEILGLNDEFENLTEVPVVKKRIEYLERVLAMSGSENDREYTHAILLFSLFTEHVSLFSQFLIIMAFNKHENLFKGISNAVEATSKEEQIHGLFGIDIVNKIKAEHPEWFDDAFEDKVRDICRQALEAEEGIVDWIYEDGELEFLPKKQVMAFIKHRLNNSLESIGYEPEFVVDKDLVAETKWFDEEVIATKHVDFFNKRSINYNKRSKSITSDDLF